jgi:hypothetical protein
MKLYRFNVIRTDREVTPFITKMSVTLSEQGSVK